MHLVLQGVLLKKGAFLFFKNKHIVVSLIVAPILAILGYFATNYLTSEKPHNANAGDVYSMRVYSNCRWESNECTIDNKDVRLDIRGHYINSDINQGSEQSGVHNAEQQRLIKLSIQSNPLSKVLSEALGEIKIAFDNSNDDPQSMLYNRDTGQWEIILQQTLQSAHINIVVLVNDSLFFAQVPTIFLGPLFAN